MKLHLPCALRGALLACFAVAGSTTARAAWDGDSYIITENAISSLATADGTVGDNGIFIRTTDGSYSATTDVQTATISKLIVGNDRVNLQGHWSNPSGNAFTALTLQSVVLGDGISAATVNVYEYNTVYLSGTSGVIDSGITMRVNGTLCMDFALWNEISSQVVGVSASESSGTGGSESTAGGVISFFGTIDTTNSSKYDFPVIDTVGGSYTFEDVLTNYENFSLDGYAQDNLSFEFAQSGWNVKADVGYAADAVWQEDGTMDVTVTYIGVGRKQYYADGVTPPAPITVNADFQATAETAGVLTQIENVYTGASGSEWTVQVYGVVIKPEDPTQDLVLLTNTDSNIAGQYLISTDGSGYERPDSSLNLSKGDFAIYLTSDGRIMLHHSNKCHKDEEASKGMMATYCQIGTLGTTEWTTMEFSFYLTYSELGADFKAITFKPTVNDNTVSYFILRDADGKLIMASYDSNGQNDNSMLSYISIDVGKAVPSSDLSKSIYTCLTENSYVSVGTTDEAPIAGSMPLPSAPVLPENVYWYIVRNATASIDGLWRGDYLDYDTKEGTPMSDSETIVFTGGTLSTDASDEARSITLNNALQVENANSDEAGVKLAPGKNTQLVISNGEQALTTTSADGTTTFHGLEIGGEAGSSVVLMNVTSTTPENITVKAGGALAFSGTRTYTIDANNATIHLDEAASLGVLGGGTLVFRADEVNGSTLNELFGTSSTVKLENNVTATLADVDKLSLTEGSSLHTTAGVIANTIDVASTASISTDTSIAAATVTLEADSAMTAANNITAEGGTIDVGANSTLTAGATVSAKTLTLGTYAIATAESVATSGDISMGDYANLSATDIATEGFIKANGEGSSITTTGELSTKYIWVWNNSTVDIGDGALTATGSASIRTGGVLSSSNFIIESSPSVNSDTAAFASGLIISGNTLVAPKALGATITVQAPGQARANGTQHISLGEATSVTINGADSNVQISDTTFTTSSVTVQNGALTLSNTVVDAATQISVTGTGAQLSLSNTTLDEGSALTVQGATFTVGDTSAPVTPTAVTISGTASNGTLTLTSLYADISSIEDADVANGMTLIVGGTDSTIDKTQCDYTLVFSPGLAGELHVDATTGDLYLEMWDNSEGIIFGDENTEGVATHANAIAAAEVLHDASAASGDVMNELYKYLRNSSVVSLADRQATLNQLSSGSIAMLADSQRRGVSNTITTVRNRVIQMGNELGYEPETHVHAWIQADGAYNDIDQDGANAGYELQSWGGTVGAHVDTGDFSFGAAISAAYGDLTAHSADRAEGNLDTISASIFARHQSGKMTQLGILSFGSNDLEMERKVHTYEAEGDATGYTITAYYEAGYTIVLNEDASHVLQPLVSAMLTSAHMGDFSESGTIGNAGLNCEAEDYFYGTVGIGARYQAVLGTDVNDRVAFFEARAKVVADFGDDTHEATVSFNGAPGTTFTQLGAEVGKVGVQVGAGISIPFGMYKTLFADVDADFRDCATSVSGSVGIRVEF